MNSPKQKDSIAIKAKELGISESQLTCLVHIQDKYKLKKDGDGINDKLLSNRRSFLKLAIQAGVAGLLYSDPVKRALAEKEPEAKKDQKEASQALKSLGIHNFSEIPKIQVSMDAVRLYLGNMCMAVLAHSVGIKSGNSTMIKNNALRSDFREWNAEQVQSMLKAFNQDPKKASAKMVALMAVKAPVLEESLFRYLPSLLAGTEGKRWDVGIASSIMFGFVHNISKGDPTGIKLPFNRTFTTDVLPLPQIIIGLFYWHLMREYGLSAAILAHSTNNLLPAMTTGIGQYAISSEFQKKMSLLITQESENNALKD